MLGEALRKQCIEDVVKLLGEANDQGGGAFCHYPIHGLRLYREEDLIFQTSLCWKCSNYFFEYPDGRGARWVGFYEPSLETFLKKHMPIPKEEIERFESVYGNNKSNKKNAAPKKTQEK